MKNLLYFVILLLLVSCKKSDNNILISDIVSRTMDISFVNVNGFDLLDQGNPIAFNKNSIFLYHQINGQKILYNAGALMDYPNGIHFYCERPLCAIRIVLADTTYLELNDQITDTIYAEIVSIPGNTSVKKIWYNGEFLWNIEDGDDKYFTIVK